ncbi:dihydrodipicolinate synthase family protein [Streptomyces sp. NPDC053560]|uniref:dihydrodipicolinate synthase family protein n=1 Tax=Streptomyces sp. NPDC053560 TaxID=3365711 RepID=UPI0037CF7AB7
MLTTPLSGVIPVVPTVFDDDEELDLAGLARVVDYLIDGGADALCILANYSEQFSLTDEERDRVCRTVLEHTAGRVPTVVTTSHYSARVAARRSKDAQAMGADMIMLMPPFFGATMAVPEAALTDYFTTVAAATDLPLMVQDAPMSTTPLPVGVLVHLIKEVPQLRYAKIETPGAADKLRTLIAAVGDQLEGPFDGEEAVTLIPDLDAGAVGTMSSSTVPDRLGRIVRRYHAGDREGAVEDWEALLPLIHFENRQCGLRAQKILLAEGGVIGSDRTRAPFGPVPPETRESLLELARRHDPLVLRWAR